MSCSPGTDAARRHCGVLSTPFEDPVLRRQRQISPTGRVIVQTIYFTLSAPPARIRLVRTARTWRPGKHAPSRPCDRTALSARHKPPGAKRLMPRRSAGRRAGRQHRPTTLRDLGHCLRTWPAARSSWAGNASSETAGSVPGLRRRLPGRRAECSGMGPAVVLGEDLAEAAGPTCDGVAAVGSWWVPRVVRLGSVGPGCRSAGVQG